MLYAFTLSPKALDEFFRRVDEYDADTKEGREAILVQLVQEGIITGVVATWRSKEKYIEDLKKNFNVLDASEGFGDGQ